MPEEEKIEIQVPGPTENKEPGLLQDQTEQPLPDTSVA